MTHVVLVAFEVEARSMAVAQRILMNYWLPEPSSTGGDIESWWIAEDERYDGSDCDSAVFVPVGMQAATTRLINYMRESAEQAVKLRPF